MRQPDYVSSATCARVLTPALALELAELALQWEAAGTVYYPPARALRMAPPDTGFHFHSKAVAVAELGVAGCRIVGYPVAADGSRPGADGATRLVVLMDLATGAPLAIVDEHVNYALRTAASVGVAARILAPGPVRLGIVGAGTVARASLRIMVEALQITAITLTSRTIGKCEELARLAHAATSAPVTIVDSADRVLRDSDVIVTATTARAPIVTEPLRPGVVLCALGSNELSPSVYLGADRFLVDDWQQTERATDIAAMLAAGYPLAERVSASLAALVATGQGGRSAHDDTAVVRTEGLASQDILFAHRAWQESMATG
jgi:ornithine cyclodeaminase